MNSFMYGLVDELSKNAGWADVLKKSIKEHIKPKDAIGDVVSQGKERVRETLENPEIISKTVDRLKSGGGSVIKSPAARGGAEYLKSRGRGLLGSLGKRLQNLEKDAVYKPPGVPSLSSTMPGKIPKGRIGKLIGSVRPKISKRMAAAKELKVLRSKGSQDERPTLGEKFKRWKSDPLGLLPKGLRELGADKPGERRRSAVRHLAGKRSEAAGEPYARGVAKQDQSNMDSESRRSWKGFGKFVRKIQESQPGYVKKSKKGLEASNSAFIDRHLEPKDSSDWWKRGEKPPKFGG